MKSVVWPVATGRFFDVFFTWVGRAFLCVALGASCGRASAMERSWRGEEVRLGTIRLFEVSTRRAINDSRDLRRLIISYRHSNRLELEALAWASHRLYRGVSRDCMRSRVPTFGGSHGQRGVLLGFFLGSLEASYSLAEHLAIATDRCFLFVANSTSPLTTFAT